MAQVFSSSPLNISFHQNLMGANLSNWHSIVVSLQDVNLMDERDIFVWGTECIWKLYG